MITSLYKLKDDVSHTTFGSKSYNYYSAGNNIKVYGYATNQRYNEDLLGTYRWRFYTSSISTSILTVNASTTTYDTAEAAQADIDAEINIPKYPTKLSNPTSELTLYGCGAYNRISSISSPTLDNYEKIYDVVQDTGVAGNNSIVSLDKISASQVTTDTFEIKYTPIIEVAMEEQVTGKSSFLNICTFKSTGRYKIVTFSKCLGQMQTNQFLVGITAKGAMNTNDETDLKQGITISAYEI